MLEKTKLAVTQLDILERNCPLSRDELLARARGLEERAPSVGNRQEQWFMQRQAADLRSIVYRDRDVSLLIDAALPVAMLGSGANKETLDMRPVPGLTLGHTRALQKALWTVGCHLKDGAQPTC